MEREQIIGKVRAKLDELSTFTGGETIENPLIDLLLDECSNAFLLRVPAWLLTGITLPGPQLPGSDGTGTMPVPSDFLRLLCFKMTAWKREVTDVISPDNPKYYHQNNNYLRGGEEKPVVAIIHSATGERLLKYFSVVTNHNIEKAIYFQITKPEDMNENLIDGYTWEVAAKVLQVIGEHEASKVALNQLGDWIISRTK